MNSVWELEDASAISRSGPFALKLQPTQPGNYLQLQLEDSCWKAVAVRPQPRHSLQAEEVYVRQSDCIVRFKESADDTYAIQLQWQTLPGPPPGPCGVELWASVHTSLLDASPELVLASEGTAGSWHIHDASEFGAAPASDHAERPAALTAFVDGVTRVWMIAPQDQVQVRLQTGAAEAVQQLALFGEFMEKGVIRRARMRFIAVVGQLSPTRLQALYDEFANSPLPLTA